MEKNGDTTRERLTKKKGKLKSKTKESKSVEVAMATEVVDFLEEEIHILEIREEAINLCSAREILRDGELSLN